MEQYTGISLTLVILAVFLAVICARLLFRREWFAIWLRGSFLVALISLSILSVFVAGDLFSYRAFDDETIIASVGITKTGEQSYEVSVAVPGEEENRFAVAGDMWQLDARIITWSGPFAYFSVKPGYRLDRLSGRYLSLEEETSQKRTVYELTNSGITIDFWQRVQQSAYFPWVDAEYGSATFLPMQDGALFTVYLSNKGVLARPVNAPALEAIENWQKEQ